MAASWHLPIISMLMLLLLLVPAQASAGALLPRQSNPNEHFVLVDCHDSAGFSSQVAYFDGAPDDKPLEVVSVATPPGQARVWPGNTSTVSFPGLGTSFTVKLDQSVDVGAFAGTAFSGPVVFTCWRRFRANLYQTSGRTCSMAYDCTHESATATTSSTASPTPTANRELDGTSEPPRPRLGSHEPDELSLAAMIGLIVGAVFGAAAVATLAAFVILQRRRIKRERADLDLKAAALPSRPGGSTVGSPVSVHAVALDDKAKAGLDGSPRPTPPGLHSAPHVDMDGKLAAVAVPTELDGRHFRSELDARREGVPDPGPTPGSGSAPAPEPSAGRQGVPDPDPTLSPGSDPVPEPDARGDGVPDPWATSSPGSAPVPEPGARSSPGTTPGRPHSDK